MTFAYSFSVLRYVHDPVSQEFVNIGVAVYSADAGFLRAQCTVSYARISELFQKIDGQRFRQLSRYIQDEICRMGRDRATLLPFESDPGIEKILAAVLPPDDSAIQFSRPGVGLSSDLDQTLRELYQRHVEFYAAAGEAHRRSDDEVWRVFREPLDRVKVTPYLAPKRIVAPSYEYEFQRSWRNEIWHVYEPISFDMVEAGSMLEKANKWLGRATSLGESPESFRIHVLLGKPTDSRLLASFVKAQNILNKMPVRKEFVQESDADAFAEELAREVSHHDRRD
jgi:hypothetical protein